MKQVPRLASGGGEKGMWVRESTKNDGSLAHHFRAGVIIYSANNPDSPQWRIYTGVHKNIPKYQRNNK